MSITQYTQILNHHVVRLKLINVKGQLSSKIDKLLRKKQNLCFKLMSSLPHPEKVSSIKYIVFKI